MNRLADLRRMQARRQQLRDRLERYEKMPGAEDNFDASLDARYDAEELEAINGMISVLFAEIRAEDRAS